MRPGLLIAGAGLAVVAAASVVLLRKREKTIRYNRAARYGWTASPEHADELADRLRGLTLMQVGHSRGMEDVFRADGPIYLFPYLCETGVQKRRQAHRWVVVVLELGTLISDAVLSSQDWLLAAANLPGRRRIPVGAERPEDASHVAWVTDESEWQGILTDAFREWLAAQPPVRSWECVGGLLVGYDPGPVTDATLTDLPEAARQFQRMIIGSVSIRTSSRAGELG